jgi:phosphoglycolate phosphatase
MTDLSKYSHIIWDWNGTLLNDAWLCVDVMNGMLAERNLPLRTVEQYMAIFDFPVKDYYQKLGYDFEKEPFEVVGMEFMVRYNMRQRESSLHEGVIPVLEAFKAQGFRQYILSAREQNELIEETLDLGVFGFFDHIYGLDDHYAHGKSDVGVKLLEEIRIPRDKIVFIGDTRHDAEVAGELGIDCILIPNGHHTRTRLAELGLPLVSSLNELKALL